MHFRVLLRVPTLARSFSLLPQLRLKHIVETESESELVVQGQFRESERPPYLLHNHSATACALCSTNLQVKHTDVLILSQFVRSDGCMLPRRVTGLCWRQQKRIATLVAMAQKAGLMAVMAPPNSKCDPKSRQKWKKFNTYFDEATIKV